MGRTDSGLLIAFEGIDGAGKTTQVGLFTDFLTAAGVSFVRSKEPTNGQWGKLVRASAQTHRLSPTDELAALRADRDEHVRDLIGPALAEGKTVVLDRYIYSTIAYQGSASGTADQLDTEMHRDYPTPDAVVLIDVPPAVGLSRIAEGRGETPNAFEQLPTLTAVRDVFLTLAKRHPHFVQIDGAQSVAKVRAEVVKELLDGPLKARHCAKAYGCEDPFNCIYRKTDSCRWATMMKQAANLAPVG